MTDRLPTITRDYALDIGKVQCAITARFYVTDKGDRAIDMNCEAVTINAIDYRFRTEWREYYSHIRYSYLSIYRLADRYKDATETARSAVYEATKSLSDSLMSETENATWQEVAVREAENDYIDATNDMVKAQEAMNAAAARVTAASEALETIEG